MYLYTLKNNENFIIIINLSNTFKVEQNFKAVINY